MPNTQFLRNNSNKNAFVVDNDIHALKKFRDLRMNSRKTKNHNPCKKTTKYSKNTVKKEDLYLSIKFKKNMNAKQSDNKAVKNIEKQNQDEQVNKKHCGDGVYIEKPLDQVYTQDDFNKLSEVIETCSINNQKLDKNRTINLLQKTQNYHPRKKTKKSFEKLTKKGDLRLSIKFIKKDNSKSINNKAAAEGTRLPEGFKKVNKYKVSFESIFDKKFKEILKNKESSENPFDEKFEDTSKNEVSSDNLSYEQPETEYNKISKVTSIYQQQCPSNLKAAVLTTKNDQSNIDGYKTFGLGDNNFFTKNDKEAIDQNPFANTLSTELQKLITSNKNLEPPQISNEPLEQNYDSLHIPQELQDLIQEYNSTQDNTTNDFTCNQNYRVNDLCGGTAFNNYDSNFIVNQFNLENYIGNEDNISPQYFPTE